MKRLGMTRIDTLEIHQVHMHRNFDCEHYTDCVQIAAKKGWESFSCKPCTLEELRRGAE